LKIEIAEHDNEDPNIKNLPPHLADADHWLLDTGGATCHTTNNKEHLRNPIPVKDMLVVASKDSKIV
jgi:hypothetical protein